MLEKVKEYVKKHSMLENGDKVIVGVSGGADSVCLLFVLFELQKHISFEIIVVHVNHGLRGEAADNDETFVKDLCKQNNVLCITYFENVELIAKNRKQSTEEAGRNVRRETFLRTKEVYGGTKIALAHHMNDNVETFFLNLSRGTGLKGLGGIQPVTGEFIRPLLCLKRQEIEQFLKEREISYCVDQTNASDDYTRNRLRNRVIPYLENEINSNVIVHIDETMEQLREIQNFMDEQKVKYMERCVVWEEEEVTILKKEFEQIPKVFQALVLKSVLSQIAEKEKDISAVHLRALQELFSKQVGRKLDMPYEILARRTYEGICFKKKRAILAEKFKMEIPILQNGETEQVILTGKQKITCKIVENVSINDAIPQKSDTKWFDYDIIQDGLMIRTRRQGDYIAIGEKALQKQKLKSYFINEKIPQEERDGILLLAEESKDKTENHILWILGYRTSCRYQVNRHTKRVLEIKLEDTTEKGKK